MEKLKLASVKTMDIKSHKLIIAPDTGGWLLLDGRSFDLVSAMNGERTIKEIAASIPNVRANDVLYLAQTVKEQGLTEGDTPPCQAPRALRPHHAVLNVTDMCNLKCKYCYASAGAGSNKKMTVETAIRIADEMLKINESCGQKPNIVFHGGEPLLNLEVIQAVCEHVEPLGDKIALSLQTNATMIEKKHIELFKKYNVKVGVSLDGPSHLNDLTRCGQDGSGSYNDALRGIKALQEEGMDVGTITVLNRHNYAYTGEMIDHLLEIGVKYFAFNSLIAGGRCKDNEDLFITGKQQFEAYKAVADKIADYNSNSKENVEKIHERNLSSLAESIFFHRQDFMCMKSPCGAGIDTLGFSAEGDVYICDDFIGDRDFVLGNINSAGLEELLEGNTVTDKLSASAAVVKEKCSACVWKLLCGGECSAYTYYLSGTDIGGNPNCDFRKLIIPYLFEKYVDEPSLPYLLRETPAQGENKHLYFNINYNCNSSCIFCAADFPETKRHCREDIDGETFASLLKINRASPGDHITINGGEPTVSVHLQEILTAIYNAGATSCLFTNGRRLGERVYCKSIIETGVDTITIPLFGYNAMDHDSLTGTPGSFGETVCGIENILDIRQQENSNVELILKLLVFKPTLDTNPKILRWILEAFPEVDGITLNSLIVSETVRKRAELLVPDVGGWKRSLNETLDYAREKDLQMKVRLGDVPLCLLEERNYGFLPARAYKKDNPQRYFDANTLGGKEEKPDNCRFSALCGQCAAIALCGFINRTYYNDTVARDSVEMLFTAYSG